MRSKTSFITRSLAMVLALVLLLTSSNLGVALRAFAVESGEVSVAGLVADNYNLTEAEKALLKSGYLVADTKTVPAIGSNLVSVDTAAHEITADSKNGWVPTTANIIKSGTVVETVDVVDGKAAYTDVGNAFSVEVNYEYRVTVAAATQQKLLSAAGYLKQGVANTDAVAAQSSNLGTLELAMPDLVYYAENGIANDFTAQPVQLRDESKAAIRYFNDQMTANSGSLSLSAMIAEYKDGAKTDYLMNKSTDMKAEISASLTHLKNLSVDIGSIHNMLNTFLPDDATTLKVEVLKNAINNLKNGLDAISEESWDVLAEIDLVSSVNYSSLDNLVAALGSSTSVTVNESLLAGATKVQANVSMWNVDVTVAIKTVSGKDSAVLTERAKETIQLTLPEGATKQQILDAIAADGIEGRVKTAAGEAYVEAHFAPETTTLPATLTEDISYTVTYSPKEYAVTYTGPDWDLDAVPATVPYGYQMTLPKHEDPAKAYDYTVGGDKKAQGEVITIEGDTEIARTAGKAYAVTDLYSVVADNFGDAIAKAILKSGALKGNTTISVRKPDPAEAEDLLELVLGTLTVQPSYPSDYMGLNWAPYTYGAEGNENFFSGTTAAWSEKEVKVKYILALSNFTEAEVADILALAKPLKEEADDQVGALNRLAAYYTTMGELDETKLGAMNGAIDVTDFTPGDDTKEDAENLELRAYFKGLVGQIMANNLAKDAHRKIYNMMTGYPNANSGGLSYYYHNSSAMIDEINTLSNALTDLVGDADKKAALGILMEKAGYPQYVAKIENLEQAMADVKAGLKAPNAAIDLTSDNLANLIEALNTTGTVGSLTAGVPYLLSDALTALDESQVNAQVILTIGNYTETFTTASINRGETLTQAAVNELKAKITAALDAQVGADKAPHYALTITGQTLDELAGNALDQKVTTYYTYSPKEYTVQISGEADQTVTVEKRTITLPKHTEDGWFYTYTIGSKPSFDVKETDLDYIFTVADLSTLFTNGTLTITRTAVNEVVDKLEKALDKLNDNAKEGNTYELKKDTEGNYTEIVANVTGNKTGLMSFAMDFVQCGYTYIGLNDAPFVYMNDSALEISLQTLIDAVLNDNTFGSQTLIALGTNGSGKLLQTNMQLGDSEDDLDYANLKFTLNMNSVPSKLTTVANGLSKVKNYLTFQSKNGQLQVNVTLPQKVYGAYLTALLTTGNVDKSDMNAVNNKIAFEFLNDYLMNVVEDDTVTTTTFNNTLQMLGIDRDLTGYEEYYQLVRKALTSDGFTTTAAADGVTMDFAAKGQSIINVIESFGFDLSAYDTYLGMIKELKTPASSTYARTRAADSNTITATAVAVLSNTETNLQAALVDVKADRMLNKVDFTADLPGRVSSLTNQAAIILLDDVTGNLTFPGTTVLDLNGHTITGNITANGRLFIFDSSMSTTACGGVTGTISGSQPINIVGGTYTSDVSAYINDGYSQNASGTVVNDAYTIVTSGDDVTFLLNTDVINDGENLSLKTLAADIAVDLALNYFTSAALTVDGNNIYAANLTDLLALYDSSTTIKDLAREILDCIGPDVNDFINQVIADLLDFAAIEQNIQNGQPVASYNLTTEPWAVEIEHIAEGDYLTVNVVSNPANAKSFNVSLIVDGRYADKAAELAGALADIVVADETHVIVDFNRPTYSNKTLSLSGSVDAQVSLNFAHNKDYQKVLAVILAYGNPAHKDALVSAIGNSAALQNEFNTMTVKEVFDALKAMSRTVSFADMANAVGATDLGDAADLESVFHTILCAAGKVLEELDITGYTDKTMGQLQRSCGRYVLERAPRRTADITRRGYTLSCTGVADNLTLAVSIFGTGLLGDADSDGDVDNIDAMLIARYAVGRVTEDELNLCVCDVNGDGVYDNVDAMLVARRAIDLIPKFPIE